MARAALALVFEGAIGDYGYALPATGAAISAALDDVYLDAGIAIDLDLSRAVEGRRGASRHAGQGARDSTPGP